MRWIQIGLFVLSLFFITNSFANGPSKTIRIGYQKDSSLFLMKQDGSLEKKFKDKGISVRWVQFLAGPQLLEALNANSIDFGVTGETPPVFAQAAGVPLVYVGSEPAKQTGEAIIVPENSPIHSVQDLKGKTIAFNKGANVQYLVVRALQKAGLSYSDIKPVYLTPSDGLAAFQSGHVDALATWDPFLALAQQQMKARTLTDGKGLVNNYLFYFASQNYAKNNGQTISDLINEINQYGQWINTHYNEAATIMASALGFPKSTTLIIVKRQNNGAKIIDPAVMQEQQKVADSFYELKLIPKKINVSEATWKTIK